MDNINRANKCSYKSIETSSLSTREIHKYLLSGIAPRPIAFVSSIDSNGLINLSPFSFFNVFGANPPLLIFSPARRVRDNTIKHTLENVRQHQEVVINMVDFAMVEQMSLASTEYDVGINEFIKAGFTQLPSDLVAPPRVGEAPVAFECVVKEIVETGTEGGAGNLVFCEVLKIHFLQSKLDKKGDPDPLKLDLVGRMGGNWYCRTNTQNMFEISKPLQTKGIGVDRLPQSARNSKILTGNNLGRLGNMEFIPSDKAIQKIKGERQNLQRLKEKGADIIGTLHKEVRQLLRDDKVDEALTLLWLADDFRD